MGASNVLEHLTIPAPRRGPNGGNLDDPARYPDRRNAPLNAPVIETADGERIIGLHDPREQDTCAIGVLKESPWIRMAAHMLNRGFTNVEVAEAAGKTKDYISKLRAQRWFNELCATLAENKEATVRARLDGYALDAVEGIAEIAFDERVDEKGNPIVPTRVKLDARRTLLEHAHGKPTQKVLSVTASTHFSSEKEEYDAIISELQSQLPSVQPPTQHT